MTEKNKIREGWKVERLGDFATYQKGKKPKKYSNEKSKEYCIPYVNIQAFEKNIIDEYTNGEGCVMCEEDDFLMVWDGSRSGLVGKAIRGALGSTLMKINFPGINKDFAFYFLQSKFLQINTKAKGVGIPHVDPSLLWDYQFPIPPINEQHSIVSKIEQLFSELDKGIESLKTAQQQLKIYRQSVLRWAFEGKLTAEWRSQNHGLNDYTDESQLKVAEGKENYKTNNLPEGWKWVTINQETKINPKIPFEIKNELIDVSFLPMKLVEEEKNVIHLTEFRKYSEVKKGFTPMINGDVIFAKITPCMENGKIAIVNNLKNDIAFGSTEFHVLRCNEKLYNKFLFYFVVQEKFRKEAEFRMSGAVGQRRVPKKFLEDYIIPLPTLEEQRTIIKEIESRLSVSDKLEETIKQNLQQAEALRQSILKRAFEGRLLTESEL